MQKWQTRFERSDVRCEAEVHHFLYGAGAEHDKACLSRGHYIRVVVEDGQGVLEENQVCHTNVYRHQCLFGFRTNPQKLNGQQNIVLSNFIIKKVMVIKGVLRLGHFTSKSGESKTRN